MNQPCERLVNEATGPEGLVVLVEGAKGKNFADWDSNRNPEGMKEWNIRRRN
jgi:hypothetical protein